MTVLHLLILQICACAVFVSGKRLDQLEKRVQAIQTLAFQDIQILKETVDKNSLKIDNLTDLVNRTMAYITDAVELTTDLRHEQEVKPMERYENDNYQTPTVNEDVKRLKRAFQEQKMYSISLQENMLAEVEKAINRVKDALIKNITDLKSEMKTEFDEMSSGLSDINNNTSHMLTDLSRDQSYTKMQTDEILDGVNNSQYMISDSISAVNSNGFQILKKCSNISDQLVEHRFEIEKRLAEHSSTINDHLNTAVTNILIYLRINPNVRLVNPRVVKESLAWRVEVQYNETWGTVCDDYFTDVSATVACRMAGFNRGVAIGGFGGGSGQISLDNVQCTGSETNLFDCPRKLNRGIGEHDCGHGEDVGVRCF